MCPGEPRTSLREDNVRIVYVQPRCGLNRLMPCNALTLAPSQKARFGVVIENLSPTEDPAYFLLRFQSFFDTYNKKAYQAPWTSPSACGTSGLRAGLMAHFSSTELLNIPYNLWTEVPFVVTNEVDGGDYLCNVYNDVMIEIVSWCEQDQILGGNLYQYGTYVDPTTSEVTVQYDVVRGYPLGSAASFSVTFPPVSGINRRQLDSASLAEQNDVLMIELQSVKDSMKNMMTKDELTHLFTLVLAIGLLFTLVLGAGGMYLVLHLKGEVMTRQTGQRVYA